MKLYSQLAEYLQYISPSFYKKRFYKKLISLTPKNIIERSVEPEFLWFSNYLDKNSVFLDIGANVGAYIFILENRLKHENIYAFEPNAKLYKRLNRLFPFINLFDIALSNENTEAEFKIPIINGQNIHTRGTLQVDFLEENEERTVLQKVKVRPLDELNLNISRLDFIKIDVEGNEMLTLRGAKNTISQHRPTLMVEMEQRHHKEPVWQLISEIESWGYKANYLERETFKLKTLTEEFLLLQNAKDVKNYKFYINNIIFLPNN
ncbi:FkbM family methyltransferase [Chryseobacterium sp. T1]